MPNVCRKVVSRCSYCASISMKDELPCTQTNLHYTNLPQPSKGFYTIQFATLMQYVFSLYDLTNSTTPIPKNGAQFLLESLIEFNVNSSFVRPTNKFWNISNTHRVTVILVIPETQFPIRSLKVDHRLCASCP